MNKMTCCILFLGTSLSVSTHIANASSGSSIALQGNSNGAPPCVTCHGGKALGRPLTGIPYLNGQPKAYLIKQLNDFANDRRVNTVMQQNAGALTSEEINAVANYYSKLPLPEKPTDYKNEADNITGKRLTENGKWSSGVPACFKCHGDRGQGIAPHFPAITGQPATYIETQLSHWKQGKRSNDPTSLMQAVVSKLTQKEMSAVADYLASKAPAETFSQKNQ